MTLFVGGLLIGFAIGWGMYWSLSQSEVSLFQRANRRTRSSMAVDVALPLVSMQRVDLPVSSPEVVRKSTPDLSPSGPRPLQITGVKQHPTAHPSNENRCRRRSARQAANTTTAT